MINWEYHDYRPEGFECYKANWGSHPHYSISVAKLVDNGTRYTVRWYYKDMTEIKEHIDAENWEEAKSAAISIVGNYITRNADYWCSMRNRFISWTDWDED